MTTSTETTHACTQTEIHFIAPAYSYTKQLCMVNWSAFPDCFCQPSKFMTDGIVPMEGSNMAVGNRYCSHCQYTSV